MNLSRSVALVGRPNVGKSQLFNRLTGRRIAIVHDQPGVTRDIVSEVVKDGAYTLMDTGGIGIVPEMTPEKIHDATEEQVDFAISAASLVLFVTDAKDGCTQLDKTIANKLRTFGKETILLVNKIDAANEDTVGDDFYELGMGDPVLISAEHGLGTKELKKVILDQIGPAPEEGNDEPKEHRISICLAGRPNVGKSSLGNKLLNSQRLIVSDVPGTTRDAVAMELDYKDEDGKTVPFRIVDTAGLKMKKKISSSVEYFSSLRSNGAIDNTDIVFMVLDAEDGVTKFEKKLGGDILEAGKALVVIVNKWDVVMEAFAKDPPQGFDNEKDFRKAFTKGVREEMFFLPGSPMIFTSAKKNYAVTQILEEACALSKRMDIDIPTSELNKVIEEMVTKRPPRVVGGKRFKIYYAVHIDKRPHTIRIYCNRETKLEDSYKRYLYHGFDRAFKLDGCPIFFELVGKAKRYSQD